MLRLPEVEPETGEHYFSTIPGIRCAVSFKAAGGLPNSGSTFCRNEAVALSNLSQAKRNPTKPVVGVPLRLFFGICDFRRVCSSVAG